MQVGPAWGSVGRVSENRSLVVQGGTLEGAGLRGVAAGSQVLVASLSRPAGRRRTGRRLLRSERSGGRRAWGSAAGSSAPPPGPRVGQAGWAAPPSLQGRAGVRRGLPAGRGRAGTAVGPPRPGGGWPGVAPSGVSASHAKGVSGKILGSHYSFHWKNSPILNAGSELLNNCKYIQFPDQRSLSGDG